MTFLTVCVVTYNSSGTLLDTLGSLRRQTCRDFELIISDDSSADNTREIAAQWIEQNGSLFPACRLIRTEQNAGIAGNINNSLQYCNGEYVTHLAGDDILTDDAIEVTAHFLKAHNSDAVIPKTIIFPHKSMDGREAPDFMWHQNRLTQQIEYMYKFFKLSEKKQLRKFLTPALPIPLNQYFIKKSIIYDLGCFDTRFYQEDVPFFVRFLAKGYKLHLIDKYLVYYRKSDFSITSAHLGEGKLEDKAKLANQQMMVKEVIYPELFRLKYYAIWLSWELHFLRRRLSIILFGNKKGAGYHISRVLHYIFWIPLYGYRLKKLKLYLSEKLRGRQGGASAAQKEKG